jgi:hypothetical protein
MATAPAYDRRRSHRHWAAVPVVIRHYGARIDGITINLSEGGMYLFAATYLAPGTQIEVEFLPPGEKQLVCMSGTVRRRALYLYGIEFLPDDATAARDRAAIDTDNQVSSQ